MPSDQTILESNFISRHLNDGSHSLPTPCISEQIRRRPVGECPDERHAIERSSCVISKGSDGPALGGIEPNPEKLRRTPLSGFESTPSHCNLQRQIAGLDGRCLPLYCQ